MGRIRSACCVGDRQRPAECNNECACVVDKALQTVESEHPMTGVELTTAELQQQMEEIQREMEKRTERAAKYKRLYYEEKKRCEEVTAQLQMLMQVMSCAVLCELCRKYSGKYNGFIKKRLFCIILHLL